MRLPSSCSTAKAGILPNYDWKAPRASAPTISASRMPPSMTHHR
jgi:hypothetical protein